MINFQKEYELNIRLTQPCWTFDTYPKQQAKWPGDRHWSWNMKSVLYIESEMLYLLLK